MPKRPPRRIAQWPLQDAKNKLSEVVAAAASGEPQVVTRRGIKTAVVISYREYERAVAARRRSMPSLSAYLLTMPQAPEDANEFERLAVAPRDVDI